MKKPKNVDKPINTNSKFNKKKETPKPLSKIWGALKENGDFDFENYGNEILNKPEKQEPNFAEPKKITGGLQGAIAHVNSRFGFIMVTGFDEDFKVLTEDMLGAWDGDIVGFELIKSRNSDKTEAKVTQIIERKRTEIVGELKINKTIGFVIPDSKRLHNDIFVDIRNYNGAKNGEKVIVKIKEWSSRKRKAEGIVTQILGKAGEHNTEMHAIMAEFDLPFGFDETLENESAGISDIISDYDISQRRDFRGTPTFTIDPEDAKDFDDALSFYTLPNGNFEIGVHIADVTHYVKEGSNLEKEAYRRATSVYLVDRVIPMLPEKLSNNLCSLRPNEDKLTFSVVFEISENAEIAKTWFGRTIIHSQKRFSYEQAQEILEGAEGNFKNEVLSLNTLAQKFKAKRIKNGAIGFETVEVKFKLDPDGVPLEIYPKVRKEAHKLIEEFMLLANKYVAEFVFNLKKAEKDKLAMVYRTHGLPDAEKIDSLRLFAGRFGYKFDTEESRLPQSLNKLSEEVEGKPEGNILQNLAIRCMAKAKYTSVEDGHFGLAFKHYSHFTSPIRRYPDMMAHRLLQRYLDKKGSEDRIKLEEQCKHSSEKEKKAAEAERASIKYKQVELMASMPKIPMKGIVSGVTDWGVYVEITQTRCEGMVRFQDIKDDFFEFDSKSIRAFSKKTGKSYTLGDEVWIKVKQAHLDKRAIDLVFVETEK